jgi:hypothetical protein
VTRVTPQVIEFAKGTHRIGLTKEQLSALPFRIAVVETATPQDENPRFSLDGNEWIRLTTLFSGLGY